MKGGFLAVVGLGPADLHTEPSALLHRFLKRLTAPGAIALRNENKGVAAPAQPDSLTAWKWGTAGAAGGNPLAYWLDPNRSYQHRPNSPFSDAQLTAPKACEILPNCLGRVKPTFA